MNLVDYMSDLAQPFAPQDIDFLPKNTIEKNGQTLCLGLPFTDPRTYQDRLNAVCPGEWSTQASITVASNKILALVTVTVCGVPHTDIGESFLTGEVRGKTRDEENTGTEAFAQAFKRACAQFGLGRYIYALPKQYLPYDKERKRFNLNANEKREAVMKMYRAAGIIYNAPKSPRSEAESLSSRHDHVQDTEQQKDSKSQHNGVEVELHPAVVANLRSQWAEAYHIPDEEIEERWPKYLVYRIGKVIADPDFRADQVARINGDIETQRRKVAKAS